MKFHIIQSYHHKTLKPNKSIFYLRKNYLELCVTECVDFLPQGICFLIDSSLLKNTNEDIAKFLYKGEGLNKTAIGDYLGER